MRDERKVLADKAARLLDDDAFKAADEGLFADWLKACRALELDGSPEQNAAAAELIRELQARDAFKAKLKARIQTSRVVDSQSA